MVGSEPPGLQGGEQGDLRSGLESPNPTEPDRLPDQKLLAGTTVKPAAAQKKILIVVGARVYADDTASQFKAAKTFVFLSTKPQERAIGG